MNKIKITLLSTSYKIIRRHIINVFKVLSFLRRRPFDLELVIDQGDKSLNIFNKILGRFVFNFKIPKNLETKIYDLNFPSPLTMASFKDDIDSIYIWMNHGLGGCILKTILPDERPGNQKPRIQEIFYKGEKSFINAMGLPGKGIDKFLQIIPKSKIWNLKRPIGFSIGGNNINEYKNVFTKIEESIELQNLNKPFFYELNISCPNTEEGQDMSENPNLLKELLVFMREKSKRVIGVKLSPDFSNELLKKLASEVASIQKTYLNLGNTQYKTREEVLLTKELFPRHGGGLSGGALYPRTLEMTKLLSPIGLPIISTGGINSSKKVKELKAAGATLIGMASAIAQNQYIIPQINLELSDQIKTKNTN